MIKKHTWFALVILTISAFNCGQKKTLQISAQRGLYLRNQPTFTGKSIELLPYQSRVRVLQTAKGEVKIDGLTGQWKLVRNEKSGKEGWVFGGYLEEIPPEGQKIGESSYAFLENDKGQKIKYEIKICPEKDCLIFNAAGFHSQYWESWKNTETSFIGDKEGFIPGPHARKILQNPTAFVKVEYLQDKLAIIGHEEMGRGSPVGQDTLWLLQDNRWMPHPKKISGTKLTWIDLNGDGTQDLFGEDFRGEVGNFYVYLGSKDEKFERTQELFVGYVKARRLNGRCEANEIEYMAIADNRWSDEVRATFDCSKNEFLVKETLKRQ